MTDPGTKSGNFVPDHQPPNAINPPGVHRTSSHTASNAVGSKGSRSLGNGGEGLSVMNEISVAPANSIILVVGSAAAEPPVSMSGGLTSATSTCIAIGTLNEFDGETRVTIHAEFLDDLREGWTRHVHRIAGVEGAVMVVDIEWRELLVLPWSLDACEIVVDTDDALEPSRIRLSVRPVTA